jgi:hypothetical protein
MVEASAARRWRGGKDRCSQEEVDAVVATALGWRRRLALGGDCSVMEEEPDPVSPDIGEAGYGIP